MKKESLRWLTGSAPLCSEPFWWVLSLGLHLWRSDVFSSEQLYTLCQCLFCIILYLSLPSSCFLCFSLDLFAFSSSHLAILFLFLVYSLFLFAPSLFPTPFFFPLPISLIILSFFPPSSVNGTVGSEPFWNINCISHVLFTSYPSPPSFHLYYTQDVSQYSYHHLSLSLWLFLFLPLFSSTPLVHHCRLYRQGSSAQSYVEALLLFGIFSSATVLAPHEVFCQTGYHQFHFILSYVF